MQARHLLWPLVLVLHLSPVILPPPSYLLTLWHLFLHHLTSHRHLGIGVHCSMPIGQCPRVLLHLPLHPVVTWKAVMGLTLLLFSWLRQTLLQLRLRTQLGVRGPYRHRRRFKCRSNEKGSKINRKWLFRRCPWSLRLPLSTDSRPLQA